MDASLSSKSQERSSWLSRLPLFWKLHIAGCLLLFLGLFPLRLLVVSLETELLGSLGQHALYLLYCDVACFILALGLRSLYQMPYFGRLSRISLAVYILVISAVFSLIHVGLTFPVFNIVERLEHHPSPHLYLAASLWPRFWFFSSWSFLYFLVTAIQDARRAGASVRAAEKRRREAELLMLRSQLNPHFLFNALNTVLSESDGNQRLALLVRGLSDYMRYALANRQNLFVPLGQEVDALERYAAVQQARFGGTVSIDIVIDPSTRELPVPGVFMQPLVENAIKHGRESCADHLQVSVRARMGQRALHIQVSNSGTWVNPAPSNQDQPSGVGLETLRRQLDLLYPGRADFRIGQQDGRVVAEIVIDDPVAAANEARASLATSIPA